jgi:hypothetical protein
MEALRKSEAPVLGAGRTRGLTPPFNRSYSDCRAGAFPAGSSRGKVAAHVISPRYANAARTRVT